MMNYSNVKRMVGPTGFTPIVELDKSSKYTTEQKENFLQLCKMFGPTKAAEQTGIPKANIANFKKQKAARFCNEN